MKKLIAKYAGICSECGCAIDPGQEIWWERGGSTKHVECPAEGTKVYRLSGGSGYGYCGWTEGQVVQPPDVPAYREYPRFLYILSAKSRYVSEEGMSFGVGDEEGYIHSAVAREATDEESAPLRAQIDARQEARRKYQALRDMATTFTERGERPDGSNVPEGEVIPIGKGQNIYGGGEWFVVGPEYVWYVRNNGADGDDWSRNNVRTGGAGAIGWRLPIDTELSAFFADYVENPHG